MNLNEKNHLYRPSTVVVVDTVHRGGYLTSSFEEGWRT